MSIKMQESSVLMFCPSFSSYSSINFADVADKVTREFYYQIEDFGLDCIEETVSISNDVGEEEHKQNEERETKISEKPEDDSSGFEFAFVCRDHDSLTIPADDLFSNGQLRPFFSNQSLLVHDQASSSVNSAPHSRMLQLSPATAYYSILMNKQSAPAARCKKSNSTGTSKRWRLRDLITRSNSDSKETMVFLTSSDTCSKKSAVVSDSKATRKLKRNTKKGNDEVKKSAHELHYMRARALKEANQPRTFLPYKMNLLGFFVNVNGLSKNIHPY